MSTITITLTPQGLGVDRRTFDAWADYVQANAARACRLRDRVTVQQFMLHSGVEHDRVDGASDAERQNIRNWLAYDGWDAFCATSAGRAEVPA